MLTGKKLGLQERSLIIKLDNIEHNPSGLAPAIFRRGADSSDEGAKIWFSGCYKCQKSPKKLLFTFRRGAIVKLICLENDKNALYLKKIRPIQHLFDVMQS